MPTLRTVRHLVPTFVSAVAAAAFVACPRAARAVDAFEIQVYDGLISEPGGASVELHANAVVAGRRDAVPPELPPHHQSHFTLEPAIGLTRWWEAGFYLQTTLLGDGSFEYAGSKLRTKFVIPVAQDSPLRWAVNLELSRLPERYARDRWGAEVRPIATWSSARGAVYVSINPILDFSLAGAERDEGPSFEPAATICYVLQGLFSVGVEYYTNLGPVGRWLPASEQEHYLYEVINVLRWRRLELNLGVGEGLTGASNDLVAKMIVGVQ